MGTSNNPNPHRARYMVAAKGDVTTGESKPAPVGDVTLWSSFFIAISMVLSAFFY